MTTNRLPHYWEQHQMFIIGDGAAPSRLFIIDNKTLSAICLPGCRGPSDCVMTGQTNLPTQCWLHLLLKLHHLSLTLGNQDLINIIWDLM